MHKFKSRASRLAWYADPDGGRSLNPFGKYRPAAGAHDVEHGQAEPKTEAQSPHVPAASSDNPLGEGTSGSEIGPDGKASGSTVVESDSQDRRSRPLDGGQANGEPRRRKGLLGKFRGKGGREKVAQDHVDSKKRQSPPFSVGHQIRATILNSWINVLLVAVPIGVALNFMPSVNRLVVFIVNFIAIIPLAAMLSYATEEIALHTGETIGGLLNATFGNAVELIVSIIALFHDEIVIVQTSLIGSMLSNLLLVMGMCFLFGGLRRVEQHFNVTVAQTACSLLALAIAGLIIPTAYNKWADVPGTEDDSLLQTHVLELSRGTSILLLLVYGCYLLFQLRTHIEIYNAPSEKAVKRHNRADVEKGDASKSILQIGGSLSAAAANEDTRDKVTSGEKEEREEPQLNLFVGIFTLVWSTALVGICAEFLVDSISEVTESTNVSETFVGLVLLPIIGNAAEHATSVTVACKDKMDLAIGVAVGSSMQVALLVLPLVVVIGWIAGKNDMDLDFNSFEIIILFISVLLVNYLIGDGKSHWLEGVLLCVLYLIIALAAWFFPNAASTTRGTASSGG